MASILQSTRGIPIRPAAICLLYLLHHVVDVLLHFGLDVVLSEYTQLQLAIRAHLDGAMGSTPAWLARGRWFESQFQAPSVNSSFNSSLVYNKTLCIC